MYLANTEGEARTQRQQWGSNMGNFYGQDAGAMSFNRILIDNMNDARQQMTSANSRQNYVRFMFQMGVSVAHEICHLLMAFLTGNNRENTPVTIALNGYRQGRSGESGFALEGSLFGGVVEFYFDENDPLGDRQASMPYRFESGSRNVPGVRLSQDYMTRFVNGCKWDLFPYFTQD